MANITRLGKLLLEQAELRERYKHTLNTRDIVKRLEELLVEIEAITKKKEIKPMIGKLIETFECNGETLALMHYKKISHTPAVRILAHGWVYLLDRGLTDNGIPISWDHEAYTIELGGDCRRWRSSTETGATPCMWALAIPTRTGGSAGSTSACGTSL